MLLIRQWPCGMCSEDNKVYLEMSFNGRVRKVYEGCGGYQGRNASVDGQKVVATDAVNILENRTVEIRDQIEDLQHDLQEAIDMKERLGEVVALEMSIERLKERFSPSHKRAIQ